MLKKIFFGVTVLFGLNAQAQVFDPENIDELKKQGKLNGSELITNPNATSTFKISKTPKNKTTSTSTPCNCWIPQDSAFSVVPFNGSGASGGPGQAPNYDNDDWSTSPITLPFNFCLYGTTYNTVYINNNGNVSIGGAYSTFSSVAFPTNQYIMIAPFWGDVDTRGANSRYVHYKLTNTALIVQWDSVGYYMQHDDKRNTFQLIITNGSDPILTSGNNISFCYGDMQWTAGDASGGSNGFGGTPATVGINKDATHFIQISRFDHAGTNFTNATGSPASGVDYLDYKSFQFDCCGSSNNLPPIASGVSNCGDTLTICAVGDTLIYTTNFSPPEIGQVVTCTANGGVLGSHFSVYSTTSGANASLTFMVTTTGLTTGYYTVTVTGTDNGSPALPTTVTYVIHLVNNPMPVPNIVLQPTPACLSQNPVVTLTNCNQFLTHVWSNGDTACSFPVTTSDTLYLTVTNPGCYKSIVKNLHVSANPVVSIGGVLTYCPPTNGTTIFANPITVGTAPYSYNWDNGASTNDTLFNALNGPHTVVVTDASGCQGTASVTVTANSVPTLSITSTGNLCVGTVTLTPSVTNGTSYQWQPGGATTQTLSVNTGGTYTLNVVVNSCPVPAIFTVANPVIPAITVSGDTVLCTGDTSILTVNAAPSGTYNYSWFNNGANLGTSQTQAVSAAGATYSVVAVNASTQCSDTLNFFVNMYSLPSVSVSGNLTVCQGKNDLLTASPTGGHPGYTYTWHGVTASTQTVNVTTANVYSVTVTDTKGCEATGQIIIKVSNPKITVSKNNFICPGKTATIHASGSGTAPLGYLWYPSGSTSQTFSTTAAGSYPLVMTDLYGCKDSVVVNVAYNPVPVAQISYNPPSPVDPGVTVNFHDASTVSTGSVVWDTWTFGDSSTIINNFDPTHVYANGGHYVVTLFVRSDKGCVDTAVSFVDVNYPITIPNIITPNGDGINEYLEFKNLLHYTNNKLSIYNRWGKLLYSSDDYTNNWTGKDYSDGTYYFILEVPDIKKTYKGFFTSLK